MIYRRSRNLRSRQVNWEDMMRQLSYGLMQNFLG